jgi:hypothetical protein
MPTPIHQRTHWKENRLYVDGRLSGYSIEPDAKYSAMWRIKTPSGELSDMVNRARAKDAALAYLDRDLRARREPAGTA